jgi:hypothetical protein
MRGKHSRTKGTLKCFEKNTTVTTTKEVNLPLCLINEALCHEGVWGSEGIKPGGCRKKSNSMLKIENDGDNIKNHSVRKEILCLFDVTHIA